MMRLVAGLAGLALGVAIAWAATQASLVESFGRIVAEPWGVVSLIDLYAGFLIAGLLIWRFEPHRGLAIALIVALPILGNIVPLFWLAFRGWRWTATPKVNPARTPEGRE